MIGRDMWVAREKFFPILENVKSGKDNSDETNAEKIRNGNTDSACEWATASSMFI
jgi:hypothetical protein